MKNTFATAGKRLPVPALLLLLLGFLPGCQQEEVPQKPQPLNAFRMQLNGKDWEPSQLGQDECLRTYGGAWSSVTENGQLRPYYNVWAYQDARWEAAIGDDVPKKQRENAFQLQVMDVREPGTYVINGSFKESFTSYAFFTVNKPGDSRRYVNRPGSNSFVVEITEFLAPASDLPVRGIRGSFYGTLYNEANPLDSLTLRRGTFTLKKVNWYNFNQCAQ